MRRRGTTVLSRPDEQQTQATLMLADRLSGASVKTLQTRYSCSRRTVLRRLALARGSGLVEDAKAHIVETLVPKALHVFSQALEAGDVSVATDVLFGTGALLKNPQPLSTTTEETTDEIDTIEAYRAERARRLRQQDAS